MTCNADLSSLDTIKKQKLTLNSDRRIESNENNDECDKNGLSFDETMIYNIVLTPLEALAFIIDDCTYGEIATHCRILMIFFSFR